MSSQVLSSEVQKGIELGERPKILIVLLGALGDIARGVVVLQLIKKRYPDAEITWLVEKKWATFLKLHPDVDQCIFFEKKSAWRSIRELRKYFRENRFDITLDMQRHAKSGFLTYLSRSPIRVGFHRKNAKEGNWIFQTHTIPECSDETLKVYHYLEFAKLLGCEPVIPQYFGFAKDALLKNVEEAFPELLRSPPVSIVLGSSWVSKDWYEEGYQRLLERLLRETDAPLLLLGDGSQRPLAERLAEAIPNDRLISLAGKTDLVMLTSLLACAQVNIGPDSGPGHISAALGVPYVTLFGPTDPKRVAAFDCQEYVVKADLDCMPCKKRVCPGRQHLCMQLLSVDDILATVYRVIRTAS